MMINEEILAKFFVDEVSPEEKHAIEKWLEIEENQKIYNQFEKIWEGVAIAQPKHTVDIDAAWNKVKKNISQINTNNTTTLKPSQTPLWTTWRIAASLVGLVVVSLLTYFIFFRNPVTSPEEMITIHTQNESREIYLPDSSVVWLNQNSQIRYAKAFKQRKVEMEGEGLLQVRPNAQKPFTVKTSQLEVQVLGTVFYIKTALNEVIVQEGKVAVKAENQIITLQKDEKAALQAGKLTKTDNTDKNYGSFKNRVFVFENQPLSEVVSKLNEVYSKKIKLSNPSLKDCRITVTFENETIENISQTISETLKLGVEIKETEILLKGEKCQ